MAQTVPQSPATGDVDEGAWADWVVGDNGDVDIEQPVGEMLKEVCRGVGTSLIEVGAVGLFAMAGSFLCGRPLSTAAAYVAGRVGVAVWREASQAIARLEDAQSSGMIATDEVAARETKPYRLWRGAAAVMCGVSLAVGVSLAKDTTAKWTNAAPGKPAAMAPENSELALG